MDLSLTTSIQKTQAVDSNLIHATSSINCQQYFVFVWGSNDCCEVKGDVEEKHEHNVLPYLLKKFISRPIASVNCGHSSSWIVGCGGSVWLGGHNGLQHYFDSYGDKVIPMPTRQEELSDIAFITCGKDHCVMISGSGYPMAMGNNDYGQLGREPPSSDTHPLKIMLSPEIRSPVKMVACGKKHSIILTAYGQCFSCGKTSKGRLGLGKLENCATYIAKLTQINDLFAAPVLNVYCGKSSSFAITILGSLMCWGDNRHGQLGLHTSQPFLLMPNQLESDCRISLVGAGRSHTICVDIKNRVFSTGLNNYGQLGIDPDILQSTNVFIQIPLNDDLRIKQCSLGDEFSMVRTEDGNVYLWGRNNRQQLGQSIDSILAFTHIPTRLNPNLSQSLFFYDIGAGATHAIAVATTMQSAASADAFNLRKQASSQLLSRQYASTENSHPKFSTPPASVYNFNQSDYTVTVQEMAMMIESSKACHSDTELNALILKAFSDPHILNASFSHPGNFASLDIYGLDEVYCSLSKSSYDIFYQSSLACIKKCNTLCNYFNSALQLRWVLLIFQSPLLSCVKEVENVEKIISQLSEFIFKLSASARCVLLSMLVDYPSTIFGDRLVANVRNFIEHCVQIHQHNYRNVERIWYAVVFLQMLFWANNSRSKLDDYWKAREFNDSRLDEYRKIPIEEFQLSRIADYVDPIKELSVYESQSRKQQKKGMSRHCTFTPHLLLCSTLQLDPEHRFFLAHLNLCNLDFKQRVLAADALNRRSISLQLHQHSNAIPFLVFPVRRTNLVEDALQIFKKTDDTQLHLPLHVIFNNEQAVDAGGPRRELCTMIASKLCDPNFEMFVYNEDARTIWFNTSCTDKQEYYRMLGLLMIIAIYNQVFLPLNFPEVLYSKLQGATTFTLSHLSSVDPALANGLDSMLSITDEQLFQDTFEGQHFPNNSRTILTMHNRQRYIQAVLHQKLVEDVEVQFTPLEEGFRRIKTMLLAELTGAEIEKLICGNTVLNLNELEEGATYEGYHSDEPYIQEFWRIAKDLDLQRRMKFIKFISGSSRAPPLGLSKLHFKICRNGAEPTNRLPTAMTCFNTLLLPHYESSEKLDKLLRLAIENSEGFGLQ